MVLEEIEVGKLVEVGNVWWDVGVGGMELCRAGGRRMGVAVLGCVGVGSGVGVGCAMDVTSCMHCRW